MTAVLTLVRDAAQSAARQRLLASLHNRAEGRLVIEVVPLPASRAPDLVAAELLSALGKDHELPAAQVASPEQWSRVCAWLIANDASVVVVAGVQLLHMRAWSRLFELACVCDLEVYLIDRTATMSRKRRRWLAQWPADVIDWDVFERRFQQRTRTRRRPKKLKASVERRFPAVPDADFTSFLAESRCVLGPADFKRVRSEACQHADDFHAWLQREDVSTTSAASRLIEYIHPCANADQAVTRLRGAQIGAAHAGWSLKVDYRALHGRLTGDPTYELTVEVATDLDRFASTMHAALGAAAVLTRAPAAQLGELKMSDVARDGGRLNLGSRSVAVPDYARKLFRAHRIYQTLRGAGDNEPFFAKKVPNDELPEPKPGRRIVWYLRAIEIASGVNLRPRNGNRPNPGAQRWNQQYGISLQRVARPG